MTRRQTYAIIETRVVLVPATSAAEALELYRDKGEEVVECDLHEPRTSLVADFPISAR